MARHLDHGEGRIGFSPRFYALSIRFARIATRPEPGSPQTVGGISIANVVGRGQCRAAWIARLSMASTTKAQVMSSFKLRLLLCMPIVALLVYSAGMLAGHWNQPMSRIEPARIVCNTRRQESCIHTVNIWNHGLAPLRLLGVSEVCSRFGCFHALEARGIIPPKGRQQVAIRHEYGQSSRQDSGEVTIEFFFDDPQRPREVLTIEMIPN